jgi:hypothetical protein
MKILQFQIFCGLPSAGSSSRHPRRLGKRLWIHNSAVDFEIEMRRYADQQRGKMAVIGV